MVTLFTDPRMLDHVPARRTPSGPSGSPRSSATSSGPGWPATARPARSGRRPTRSCSGSTPPGHLAAVDGGPPARGGGQVEADTWVSPGSPLAARLAAGAAVDAVASVVEGPDRRAFCLVRPPGHHARPDDADGLLPLRQRGRRRGRRGRTGSGSTGS